MKSWKPALTTLCCLFVMVSSYHRVKVQPTKRLPPKIAAAQGSDTLATCPTCNGQPYNLGPIEVVEKYAQLVPNVWNQSMTLTPLGTRFVTYIKSLDINIDSNTAIAGFFTTFFINNFIPYLSQQPDACAMAAMINGTLACDVDRNRTIIQDALTQLQNRYLYDINPGLERTIVHKSGCDVRCGEYPPDPKVNKSVCYENGFVYPIQQVLNLPRNQYISSSFKSLLIEMHNSTDFNDRFFAVCSTYAIMEVLYDIMNSNMIAEVIDLTTSARIQQNCCYQRIDRTMEIRKIYDEGIVSFIADTKRDFATTRCN